uniref:Uncharacterized protein n=1 Tax=Anguilla anguilla TaxID=7936 RepID=A0A0E9T602_ANGAN
MTVKTDSHIHQIMNFTVVSTTCAFSDQAVLNPVFCKIPYL